jgi:hypothetical protein
MRDMTSLTLATGSARKRATASGATLRPRGKILKPTAMDDLSPVRWRR